MTTDQRTHYWQQQLDDWRNSTLSGAAFCKQHDLSYHQFTYWRRKLLATETGGSQAQGSTGFARVTAMPVRETTDLTLTLPGGIAITGLHAGNIELLGAVLRQL